MQEEELVRKEDFNSTKVRLKERWEILALVATIHFNSTKVRLKDAYRNIQGLVRAAGFQFHKGSIKSN